MVSIKEGESVFKGQQLLKSSWGSRSSAVQLYFYVVPGAWLVPNNTGVSFARLKESKKNNLLSLKRETATLFRNVGDES